MTFETKDSGRRQEFDTGSRRDTREGKGRYDLLPYFSIRRLADLYERGAGKYGDRNWAKGQPLSRYIDSMLRHGFMAAAGYTDEDHLAAVAWNALAIIDHQERIARGELPAELDDLPTPAFDTPDETVEDTKGEPAPPWYFLPDGYFPRWGISTSGGGEFTLTNISFGERPYSAADQDASDHHQGHNHD